MMALGLSSPSASLRLPSFDSHLSSSSRLNLFQFSPLRSSLFNGIRLRTSVAVPTPSYGGLMVVRMAKREEELKDIRAMTTEEINEEVVDLKGELLMLRLQRSARNEFKSSEFGRMRKRIARMLTVKREREIEEGINKRISRKLDRKWKRSIVVRPPPSLRKKLEEEQKAREAEKTS
ncbi:50S ribosomal protein L29, chloroplastic [Dioscorea cayenensis subsp. rotundata]|uniref:Large ribosomal subunit protein uL29c n=1 Tax=Dioscorea cayennensis subsp. rotundata TaxID=55577 RepID=A0AB40C194_DIOCR|nr:50S ribosomal protein L29, chloroplastic [Dioscorea cayenensis subsp. rotundata]